MSLTDLACLLDRPIAFHRSFVPLAGGVTGALMLSQAVYWTKRTSDQQGWFWKTAQEWEEETGLGRREQETARDKLSKHPFWQEERRGMPAKMFYRVELSMLLQALIDCQTSMAESAILKPESAMLDRRNPTNSSTDAPNKYGGKRHTTPNSTETTAQTTPETTAETTERLGAQSAKMLLLRFRDLSKDLSGTPRCIVGPDSEPDERTVALFAAAVERTRAAQADLDTMAKLIGTGQEWAFQERGVAISQLCQRPDRDYKRDFFAELLGKARTPPRRITPRQPFSKVPQPMMHPGDDLSRMGEPNPDLCQICDRKQTEANPQSDCPGCTRPGCKACCLPLCSECSAPLSKVFT